MSLGLVLTLAMMHGTVPHAGHARHAGSRHLVVHHRHAHQHHRRSQVAEEDAPTVPGRHHRHGRLHYALFQPSPLRGSHESLVRQNQRVEQDALERIQDDAQLEQLTQQGSLVALPLAQQLTVDPKLPEERRFCRPWTRNFLSDFAKSFYDRFRSPLQVNSAVRTVAFQQRLRRVNGNAAGLTGDSASPHLTGATVDVAKHGMNPAELRWTRDYLLQLQKGGVLDVEEEFKQPVFHITVYKSYELARTTPDNTVATR